MRKAGKLLTLSLAAIIGLSGCSRREELYDGPTSQGHIIVERINNMPFRVDDIRVTFLTEELDTSYVIQDDNASNEIGNSDNDYVVIYSDSSSTKLRKFVVNMNADNREARYQNYFTRGKGDTTTLKVILTSQELLTGKFNDMYQKALAEAGDSIVAHL